MPQPWYVHIGRLRDQRFYVGLSRQSRKSLLAEHRSGKHSEFTRVEGLDRIEWSEPHPSLAEAKHRERQLKRWSHAKKQALINGDIARLKALSKSRRTKP